MRIPKYGKGLLTLAGLSLVGLLLACGSAQCTAGRCPGRPGGGRVGNRVAGCGAGPVVPPRPDGQRRNNRGQQAPNRSGAPE